jgi:predicted glycoside hydrolase/deacetylase ChbG (UPF0249 family)
MNAKERRLAFRGIPMMLTLAMLTVLTGAPLASPTLAERLGYRATDRLLIINGDDTGMNHSANTATFDCMERGLMTSATVMVPCPWFLEVARYAKAHPEKDFGIHLTHTSEWEVYRWGPAADKADVPGLVGPDGYLWRSIEDVYAHATPEQAEREARAQIKRALAAGMDITHLDSHMGAMQYDARYHRLYLKLAKEFRLPVRMGSPETYEKAGFPQIRQEAAAAGIVFPDRLIHEEQPEKGETRKAFWTRILKNLKPGVTELYIHAGLRTEEMRATAYSWEDRATDYELFTTDPDIRKLVDDLHILRIGYRPLRDLMRRELSAGKTDQKTPK